MNILKDFIRNISIFFSICKDDVGCRLVTENNLLSEVRKTVSPPIERLKLISILFQLINHGDFCLFVNDGTQ